MLRLIENIEVIDTTPSEYESLNSYRTDPRGATNGDWSCEDERHTWSDWDDTWTSKRHGKVQLFEADLQSSSNSMTDVIGWSLTSVFYLNLD